MSKKISRGGLLCTSQRQATEIPIWMFFSGIVGAVPVDVTEIYAAKLGITSGVNRDCNTCYPVLHPPHPPCTFASCGA